jgi:hypothetical protein
MILSHQMLLITVKKYMLHVYQFSGPGSTTSGGLPDPNFFRSDPDPSIFSRSVELTKIVGKNNF